LKIILSDYQNIYIELKYNEDNAAKSFYIPSKLEHSNYLVQQNDFYLYLIKFLDTSTKLSFRIMGEKYAAKRSLADFVAVSVCRRETPYAAHWRIAHLLGDSHRCSFDLPVPHCTPRHW